VAAAYCTTEYYTLGRKQRNIIPDPLLFTILSTSGDKTVTMNAAVASLMSEVKDGDLVHVWLQRWKFTQSMQSFSASGT